MLSPARQNIHWPWAPVIIGSALIMLSIVMRIYEFDDTFINLVASAGDIVIVFSLLYIIKIFLLDDSSRIYAVATAGPAVQAVYAQPQSVAVAEKQTDSSRFGNLQFVILDVDEHSSRVRVQCVITSDQILPLTPQQAIIELMRGQKQIKDAIRSFAAMQHGPDFTITNIGDIHIERQPDNSLKLISSYTLEYR